MIQYNNVETEDLTAVVMKAATFWYIVLRSTYMNQRFGGTYHLYLHGRKSAKQETSVPAER
jgi:hypothetical protein